MRTFVGLLGVLFAVALTCAAAAQDRTKAPGPTVPPSTSPQAQSAEPLKLRIEAVPQIEMRQGPGSAWLTPTLSGLAALVGAGLGMYGATVAARTAAEAAQKTADAAINQRANEAELRDIQTKLDAFYGPYLQLSGENFLLAKELKSRQADPSFRTLKALLDPQWLSQQSKADQTLVAEIVTNGLALRDMLRSKSGRVEAEIQPVLERAGVHFTLLALAKAGGLTNDPDRFAPFVYPKDLDPALEAQVDRLLARAALLRSRPSETHPFEPPHRPARPNGGLATTA